ncbi:uncharacterized protein LOC102715326 [Oryza brachyantha]|uniref:uncharacterized protein LOC102715326 n=1 Tax=Oryza brachyantha TaxID=4533 RepID=UPI001ADB48A5|nr:uncharacterized protein LOC102715326 [Oryza brachyantha]
MSRTYTRWIHHGESINDVQAEVDVNDDELGYIADQEGIFGEGASMVQDDFGDEEKNKDSGVPSLIEDLYTAAANDENGPNIFANLIEEAKRELYPGCTEFSRLSFLIKLMHIKVYNRITNYGFNSLLQLLSAALPNGSNLPKSYNEIKNILRQVGLGYESIHACKYACAVFWMEHANDNHCLVCGESRWKDKGGKKRVPQKVLRYFSIIPRLQRIFMSKDRAECARWHKEKRLVVENEMRRMVKHGNILTQNLNHLHKILPLIEDMIRLWNGVPTYDAYADEVFSLRACFIWGIHDYPARGTMSGRSTKGYFACADCDEEPCLQRLRHKIGYVGHRRFLPHNHPWRKSRAFNGKHENRERPRKFSSAEVLEQLEKVKNITLGKHPARNKKRKRVENDKPNWCLKSSLFDLSYWTELRLQHNLDVMHIEKNICDNILGTLLDIDGKSKDTVSARLDLQDQGIRTELHLKDNGNSYIKPAACYTMNKEQKKSFCQFLSGVKFPDGYASNLTRCVDLDGYKVQGLKTHDCHILLQRILPVAIRGLVRKDIYEAIAELGNFFRELCAKTLKIDVLQQLKAEIPIILCKLEKIFPPAFFDVMVHLAVHLPDEAILRGPVQYGWMYPVERKLGTLKHFVRNKARPEGSIAEAYIASECLTIQGLHREGSVEISEGLYALAHGPDKCIRSYSSCIINGIRFNTVAREKAKKTQNCGIKTAGTHNSETIDFYGMLTEIIELSYIQNSNKTHSVILFRCEWYDLEGKKYRMKNDGYLKSINVGSRWYKDDPFILATQASQVFYLEDTKLGKNWRVVKDFNHRHIFDVPEFDRCQEDDAHLQQTEVAYHFERIMKENEDPMVSETDSEDEDETLFEYCSDAEANDQTNSTDDE